MGSNPGNKRYAVEPGTGRRVLVEAYGEKLENLDALGYRELSDEERDAQRSDYESGATRSGQVLNSNAANGGQGDDPAPDPQGDDAWPVKAELDKFAKANNIADYPESGTKAEKVAALVKAGKSAEDVK